MDSAEWFHVLLIVVVVDSALLLAGVAILVDRRLLKIKARWQFGLGSLLLAITLVAVHVGIVSAIWLNGR